MSAKLSSTEPGISRFFQRFFVFLVFSPPLPQWLFSGFLLENPAGTGDRRGSNWLQQNSFWSRLDNGFCPILYLELLANPPRYHHLALGRERDGLSSR